MMDLTHRLDRTIEIEAPRDVVFRYFTDNARWAAWWGQGSTIDARPGGSMRIRYPNAVEVAGEVVEVAAPDRIIFTYGYVSGQQVPPGGSLVTIRLEAISRGTRLHLMHEFAEATTRDHHVQGWRYQLSVFANVVSDEVQSNATSIVSAWYRVWAEPDTETRRRTLAEIAAPSVRMRDRFSCTEGVDELTEQIGAAQHFMPGVRMQATSTIRHCQGMVLVDWAAVGPAERAAGAGQNVFVFGPDGRIESVTGFWAPMAPA